MAIYARTNYIKQPAIEPNSPLKKKKIAKIYKWSKGEKLLLVMFSVILATAAIISIQMQSSIQKGAQEIQKIEQTVAEKTKQNADLSIQVSELSTYERIWEKAQALGLTLNEQNVKVVSGQ